MQDILRKNTDFLRWVIAPVGGMGGVTLSHICPHCNNFPLEDSIWWVSTGHGDSRKKKHCSWWCVVCGGRYEWRTPHRILVVQLGADANETTVFRAYAAPQALCEQMINALKLLANQQTDGDSPIQSTVTGLREKQGTYYERFEKLHCTGQSLCRGGGSFAQRPKACQGPEVEI